MNYIWELYIKATERYMDPDDIEFQEAREFSPYMELSFDDINQADIPKQAELNPYLRYHEVFCWLLDPNTDVSDEVKAKLLDLVLHHLIDVDLNMGMCRKEYQILFTVRDILEGRFGRFVRENAPVFSIGELKIIALGILELMTTGEAIHVAKQVVSSIFTDAYIFASQDINEIIFFLNTLKTKEKDLKMQVITYLFVPYLYRADICWDKMYGIMGVEEFMKTDEILIY